MGEYNNWDPDEGQGSNNACAYIKENSNAKVIFNGDGSDEVTGGYMYFHYAPNALEFDLECKRLLNEICYFIFTGLHCTTILNHYFN